MDCRTRYRATVARATLSLVGLLALANCQWQAPVTQSRYGDLRLSGIDRDSMRTVVENYDRMSRENRKLRNDAAELRAELANSKAELSRQKKLNKAAAEELRYAKSDLEHVERQFVIFEERLTRQDTKASAVAAIAETQLLYDRVLQENPKALDRATRSEIDEKIKTADELTESRKYAAAVYFAERAMRLITAGERLASLDSEAVRRVVAVTAANLRKGPGESFSIVGQLAYGTVLVELSREKDWYRVQTTAGRKGWVHKSLLR